MMNFNAEIDGHVVEFLFGTTESIDPWSLAYADENNIDVWITCDPTYFVRLDGESIYRFDKSSADDVNNEQKIVEEIKTYKDTKFSDLVIWLAKNCVKMPDYSEMIEQLDKQKEQDFGLESK